MKNLIAALLTLPLVGLQAQSPINSFDDIQFWVGTGTNRAAVILQWNDGKSPTSLVWGYRWNGMATGMQMLTAISGSTSIEDQFGEPLGSISGADGRLKLGLVRYSFGDSVYSLQFSQSDSSTRSRSDWGSGYWQYLIRGGTFEYTNWDATEPSLYNVPGSPLYAPNAWFSSPVGAADRPLVSGSWDAYSFAPGFSAQPVVQPFAAPLPLPTLSCAMIAGQPHLSFLSEVGLFYQLQISSHPAGPWLPSGDRQPGDGGTITFVDQIPTVADQRPGSRFYRIGVSR